MKGGEIVYSSFSWLTEIFFLTTSTVKFIRVGWETMETEWSKLIPKPRSAFLLVQCNECGHRQVVFDHAKTEVPCQVCGSILASPKGGKTRILGKVLETYG